MISENSFKRFLYLDALNSDLELVLFLLVGYKNAFNCNYLPPSCIKTNLNASYRDLSFIYDNHTCCTFYA